MYYKVCYKVMKKQRGATKTVKDADIQQRDNEKIDERERYDIRCVVMR